MNFAALPIGTIGLATGLFFLFVLILFVRRALSTHREAIVALQKRVEHLENRSETFERRTTSTRDNNSAIRRELTAVSREVTALRESFAPRPLRAEAAESPQIPKRGRRRKGEAKSALERVASDDEIIEGDDE